MKSILKSISPIYGNFGRFDASVKDTGATLFDMYFSQNVAAMVNDCERWNEESENNMIIFAAKIACKMLERREVFLKQLEGDE